MNGAGHQSLAPFRYLTGFAGDLCALRRRYASIRRSTTIGLPVSK